MKNHFVKALLVVCLSIPTIASATDIVKKASVHSVKETMDKFEALIKSKGMGVFARIDHKKNAAGIDMKMNDAEVLIFGNPKGGTVLMKNDISVSLDLPLRVAVYKDNDGKVWISYHNPQAVKESYKITTGTKVLDKVEGALDKLTSAVSK
ncbi:MAG TPA: DUF302 domain-containing protein [Leucothrix sp.]|nr:DUF302 domain-containing protein [Leucothrix sp.]HIQ14480.1 DUF302 domain-containing protein [Leucothrix sp.]